MSVTLDQVENIARLAMLSFSQEEKHVFLKQFNQILTYMEKLNELDTTNVEPTAHILAMTNVMRPDKAETWLSIDQALANAPKTTTEYFSVPRVIG